MMGYNAKCPICGTINHSVDLDETNGWMECERCGSLVQILEKAKTKAIPVLTPELCKKLIAHSV